MKQYLESLGWTAEKALERKNSNISKVNNVPVFYLYPSQSIGKQI